MECTPTLSQIDINFAMNEVSVSRKDTTSMITIETFLDGEYLNSYWADGLIIATPTGSTGYSLSCGGPILTPDVKGLVITPIAPHNLNARPLVIPDTTEITLKVSGREEQYLVSLDSRITTVNNGRNTGRNLFQNLAQQIALGRRQKKLEKNLLIYTTILKNSF
jgi:NAD+ kinase